MLYTETVEAGTLELLKKLMQDEQLNDFYLVGGTALSLQLGHRKSIDIDLFTSKDFDSGAMKEHLVKNYNVERIQALENGTFAYIANVKIDMLSHQYPHVKPLDTVDGIRMSSLDDIGAMKLNAIIKDGKRLKDFVYIYMHCLNSGR